MPENNGDPFINHDYSRWVVDCEGSNGEPLNPSQYIGIGIKGEFFLLIIHKGTFSFFAPFFLYGERVYCFLIQ